MSAFVRVRTSGGWTTGSTILPSELVQLDANQMAAIDAVMGGCWAPTSPIIFGGTIGGAVSGPMIVYGPNATLETKLGSGAKFHMASTGIFYQLGANHSGRTQKVLEPLASASCQLPALRTSAYLQPAAATVQNSAASIGLSLLAGVNASPSLGTRIVKEIRGWDGGTLSQVTITFQPSFTHTSLPTVMPKARVIRMGHTDVVPTVLTSTASGADIDGYVTFPTPTGSWGPQLGVQSWTIPCDQNNVVDISQYAYFLDIQDEVSATQDAIAVPSQALAPCRLASAPGDNVVIGQGLAPYYSSAGMLDGTTTINADRVLITEGATPGTCGFWTVNTSGVWARAGWQLNAAASTTAPPVNSLVYVYEGVDYAGSFMRLTSIAQAVPAYAVDVCDVGASLTLSGTYTLDGVPLAANMYVFARNQSPATDNAIWQVASGAWVRIADFAALTFTSGSSLVNASGDEGLVYVKSGTTNGNTYLRPATTGTTVIESGLAASFEPWTPSGSLWFSGKVTYTNITDTRWP